MSWGEVALLTHATQVERFNWCACERKDEYKIDEQFPNKSMRIKANLYLFLESGTSLDREI
jgi:hypothetical protein